MKFNFGRTHYGQDFSMNMHSDDMHDEVIKKFQNKYWGSVSAEQWEANQQAHANGNGEIFARYVTEGELVIHVISLEDRNNTVFITQKDLDEGALDTVRKQIALAAATKPKRKFIRSEAREF